MKIAVLHTGAGGAGGAVSHGALARCSLATQMYLRDPMRASDANVLCTPADVERYDRHWRAWRWLAEDAPADDDRALVVEAAGAGAGAALTEWVAALPHAADANAWDIAWPDAAAAAAAGLCYAVSRSGARRLVRCAVPYQYELPVFLGYAAALGLVRANPPPHRPLRAWRRGGALDGNWKIVLPDATARTAVRVFVCAVVAALLVGHCWVSRHQRTSASTGW